jgi:hypothetical protein
MTSLSTGHVRRWRRLAGLFAVLLVLAGIIPTYASEVGVANGSFGAVPNCSLAGWTTTGSGYAVARQDYIYETNSCIAELTASSGVNDASVGDNNVFAERGAPIISPQYTYVTLEQRFLVSISDMRYSTLSFYVLPDSNNPNPDYRSQTISLYNSAGQLFYSKSRNSAGNNDRYRFYYFNYNLAAYANQYVTLRITVEIDPAVAGSPTTSKLKLDFDCPYLRTASCVESGNPGAETPGTW